MADGQLRTEIQYGGEAVYGTEVATPTEIGRVLRFTPTNENNMIYSRGLGEGRNVQNAVYGMYNCGGELEWEVHDFAFLKHWIGPQSGSGNAGSHYVLTESAIVGVSDSASIQSFSMEVNHQNLTVDDTDTYVGCVGDTFTLSGRIGTKLMANATLVAQKVISSTTGTAYTPTTTNPWIMAQGTWKWGAAPTTVAGVQAFTISYANGLIPNPSIDSRFYGIPVAGLRDYNFTILVKMEAAIATTLRDNFYGQANSPITPTSSASPTADLELEIILTEGSSSTNRNATIWLDDCSIDSIGKPIALGDELVLLEVNGTAKSGRGGVPIEWWTIA